MRIDQLRLLACGPFTRATLDLSRGSYGLHILCGPNEAGKSSTRRALQYLLFGFPSQVPDRFLHDNTELRVGAVLRRPDDSVFEITRRKGLKRTLRDGHDDADVADIELESLLPGVDLTAFLSRFSLDHAGLVEGGKTILAGNGELGQMLFAAGSGIHNLGAVQSKLEEEADDIFVRQGRTKKINKSLDELRGQQQVLQKALLPSADWERSERELTELQTRRARVHRELTAAEQEFARWNSLAEARPLADQRRRLLADKQALASFPLLPEDRAAERREVLQQLDDADQMIRGHQAQLEELQQAVAQQTLPSELLAAAAHIEQLQQHMGAHSKAQDDSLKLATQHQQAIAAGQRAWRDLGLPQAWEEVDTLRLAAPVRTRIQRLANEFSRLEERSRQNQERLEQLQRRHEVLLGERDLGQVVDETVLVELERQQQKLGRLLEQAAELHERTALAERRWQTDIRKLAGWTGTPAELEELAVPAEAAVRPFQVAFAKHAKDAEQLQLALTHARQQLDKARRELAGLETAGEIPTEADLVVARERRDALWQLLLAQLRGTAPDEQTLQQVLATVPAGMDLPGVYAAAVAAADACADRLRHAADRVARKQALQLEMQACLDRQTQLAEQQHTASELQAQTKLEWQQLWSACGIEPRTPDEMTRWLDLHAALVKQAVQLREEAYRSAQNQQQLAATTEQLRTALAQAASAEQPGSEKNNALPPSTPDQLLTAAQACVERLRTQRARRGRVEEDLRTCEQELPQVEYEHQDAIHALTRWKSDWKAATAPLGVPISAEEATGVLESLQRLFQLVDQSQALGERLAQIEAFAQKFEAETAELVQRVATDLQGLPATQAVGTLAARLKDARLAQQKLEHSEESLAQARQQLAIAQARRTTLHDRIGRMCAEAECLLPEQLPEREEKSMQRRRLEQALERCDDQLRLVARGVDLEPLVRQAEQEDPEQLQVRIATVGERRKPLQQEIQDLDQKIGAVQSELRRHDCRAEAADAAEAIEEARATLAQQADEYARLRLASAVLQRAIERYRERVQGPVLKRAGELFRQLTCGSFEGLKVETDDKGNPRLLCQRRGGGRAVRADGALSEGTADQLYLALRIASLETYFTHHPALPVVLDDILINFDDDRAVSALQALAQLSKQTQVLFFTHHLHLIELAAEHLPDGMHFVTHLPQRDSQIFSGRTRKAGLLTS